jgi:hypothetical protein
MGPGTLYCSIDRLLAGQSLIVSESREIRFHSILLWIWAFAMLTCLALVLLTPTRKPTS